MSKYSPPILQNEWLVRAFLLKKQDTQKGVTLKRCLSVHERGPLATSHLHIGPLTAQIQVHAVWFIRGKHVRILSGSLLRNRKLWFEAQLAGTVPAEGEEFTRLGETCSVSATASNLSDISIIREIDWRGNSTDVHAGIREEGWVVTAA
uniref:RCC1 domain-containing protein 1 n=1 Tax=Schistocephalus solidus TaxID=70667 RepID=A0A0X3PW30_SCHSO